MSMPKRIQRSRAKGWRLPANTVIVTRPGKWGNPFKGKPFDAVMDYHAWLKDTPEGRAIASDARIQLRGKNLACWCPLDQAHCHATILLDIANSSLAPQRGNAGNSRRKARKRNPMPPNPSPSRKPKGHTSILDHVKAWEAYFLKVYRRKPRMIEREQYFIGRIDGMHSFNALLRSDAGIAELFYAANAIRGTVEILKLPPHKDEIARLIRAVKANERRKADAPR